MEASARAAQGRIADAPAWVLVAVPLGLIAAALAAFALLGAPGVEDRRGQHDNRDQAGNPGGPAPNGCCGLHQSLTSKKPIQPSSANSDTWAWNMYLPAYGKRSSRMPRSPWPWITVSVKSRGSSRVPVG